VLAWLLATSPQILPIPGTGSAQHAEENIAAAALELSPDETSAISKGALPFAPDDDFRLAPPSPGEQAGWVSRPANEHLG
jgi:diketogulonate reductase-like aldo/keto reductase